MRVAAVMTIRNEELYLERCIKHLVAQGVEVCLVDNESTDRSVEIARQYLRQGVRAIYTISYRGEFELKRILEHQEKIVENTESDWFIHQSADEILEAPNAHETLCDAIALVDAKGYNAINFDEFVFLPTDKSQSFEGTDYVKNMRYYYFFEPNPMRQIRAWKKTSEAINLADSGGHMIQFKNRKVYPDSFVIRHYMALSYNHANRKYKMRKYSVSELNQYGWNKRRVQSQKKALKLRSKECFIEKKNTDMNWNKTNPYREHLMFA